jgi:hypothetical protein
VLAAASVIQGGLEPDLEKLAFYRGLDEFF